MSATTTINNSSNNNNNDEDNEDVDNSVNDDCVNDTGTNTTTNKNNLNVRLSAAMKRATSLLHECVGSQERTSVVLERARELASRAGLTVDSYVVNPNHPTNVSTVGASEDYVDDTMGGNNNNITMGRDDNIVWESGLQQPKRRSHRPQFIDNRHNTTLPPLMKVVDNVNQTGAYSNTDHYVQRTGDKRADRIAELKRHMLRRHRAMRPEDRGEERWDKPKLPGERRRRIVREKDLDIAPPEPPATGWIAFLSQMTHKIRHDRPKSEHDQAKILQEISKLYRMALSDEDRDYYVQFARDANREYQQQLIEFRATGSYRPSPHFYRFQNVNVWVRTDLPNPLEREIMKHEQEEKEKDKEDDDDKNEDENDREEEKSNECNDKHEGQSDAVPDDEEEQVVEGGKPSKRQKNGVEKANSS